MSRPNWNEIAAWTLGPLSALAICVYGPPLLLVVVVVLIGATATSWRGWGAGVAAALIGAAWDGWAGSPNAAVLMGTASVLAISAARIRSLARLRHLEHSVGSFEENSRRQQQLNRLLARDQKKGRALINALPDMIVEVTRYGMILDCKRRQSRDLAQTEVGSIGKPILAVMPEETADEALAHVLEAIDSKEAQEFTYRQLVDGNNRAFEARVVALTDAEAIIIVRDVTEQQQAMEAMARAREEALQANRAKSEFLATMSHELRTPMNGVLGMAQVLLFGELDDDQREAAETIRSSGEGLLKILNDILQFSALDAQKVTLDLMPVRLAQVVGDVVTLLQANAKQSGIQLSWTEKDPRVDRVLVDPNRLRQILTNVISNAVKFTSEGQIDVVLRTEPVGDEVDVTLSVRDTGIGIAEEKLGAIFERFTQADGSTSRRYGGTGLGLAISRSLAELMGGTLEADSCLGEGSTFTLRLRVPRVEEDLISGRIDELEGPVPRPQLGLEVLVVEDNAVNRLVVTRLLKRLGCNVETANNGVIALEMLDAQPYDMVFMDCEMPELNGYETTERIRQHSDARIREIRIVALTANAQAGNEGRCLEVGMNAFISKPIRRGDLESVLAEIGEQGVDPGKHLRLVPPALVSNG